MGKSLRVLNVEDSEQDMALLARHLQRASYDVVIDRVDTAETMRAALESQEWDVILCDYSMPQFNALGALELMKEMKLDTPFIIISGTVGEATAVEAMRAGAQDYLMKGALTRLVPAIEREIKDAENRRARREAEEQLRLQSAAVHAAANAILITDRAGSIIWVNPAFTQHTGYSFEDVRGKNPRLLKSDKQDQDFYRDMWETIQGGRVWHNSLINRRKDGSLNREDLTITPICDESGTVTHFVGIKQDVTELVQALSEVQEKREELAGMTQQLWQASKLATMGELAASVAHELNNPLATVSLRLEALSNQLAADEQKHRAIEIVSNEVERMGKLVGNLLEFSRSGHQQISTIDIGEEIEESLELIEYQLRGRKIEVQRKFEPGLPAIQADRQQLRQVFLNILTNAGDAMPGGGKIVARALPVHHENEVEAVRVEFTDTGSGIEKDRLEKLWEPFFTTKPEGQGTGLGLAICRRIVEEHQGAISIDSRLGEGTTVTIDLPVTSSSRQEIRIE